MWPYEGRPAKMARQENGVSGDNQQDPQLPNGQLPNFALHPVGYPHPIPAHFPPAPPNSHAPVGEVKPDYHIAAGTGEPHTSAAAAYTPSLGKVSGSNLHTCIFF